MGRDKHMYRWFGYQVVARDIGEARALITRLVTADDASTFHEHAVSMGWVNEGSDGERLCDEALSLIPDGELVSLDAACLPRGFVPNDAVTLHCSSASNWADQLSLGTILMEDGEE